MSCKLGPAIRSHDTGQQIPYFDRCQLIITWMSDIKEVHGKPRLHVSVNLLLEYGRHVARLHRRRRGRAYMPTSHTASHGTHEKINSWVPFSSLIWVWGSAWRPSAAGAPLLLLLCPQVRWDLTAFTPGSGRWQFHMDCLPSASQNGFVRGCDIGPS